MRIDPKKLKIGTLLKESIYDDSGKLILPEGVRITADTLKRLRARGAGQVPDDKQLDGYAEALPGNNASLHGCKPLDKEKLQKLQWRFESASQTVSGMASSFLNGNLRNTDGIKELAADYIEEMSVDVDQVLHSACPVPADCQLASRCVQLCLISISTAMEMGISGRHLLELGTAALVHDWSLYGQQSNMRYLHERMSPQQRIAYKRHPTESYTLLRTIEGVPTAVLQATAQVHERMDGSGFPSGLVGEQICVMARILGLADAYLSLTDPLSSGPTIVPCDAVAYLLGQLSKSRFDPSVIRGFLQSMTQYPIGSLLELSDKRVVRVLRGNGKLYGHPIVQDVESNDITDLAQSDLQVVRPMLRTDPPEQRLKPTYRLQGGNDDIPEFAIEQCIAIPNV